MIKNIVIYSTLKDKNFDTIKRLYYHSMNCLQLEYHYKSNSFLGDSNINVCMLFKLHLRCHNTCKLFIVILGTTFNYQTPYE